MVSLSFAIQKNGQNSYIYFARIFSSPPPPSFFSSTIRENGRNLYKWIRALAFCAYFSSQDIYWNHGIFLSWVQLTSAFLIYTWYCSKRFRVFGSFSLSLSFPMQMYPGCVSKREKEIKARFLTLESACART